MKNSLAELKETILFPLEDKIPKTISQVSNPNMLELQCAIRLADIFPGKILIKIERILSKNMAEILIRCYRYFN